MSLTIQKDPLQSITEALSPIMSPFGVKYCELGWPDTKYSNVDGNLPSLFVFPISDTGKHLASRETVHASIPNEDGVTATVYKEKLRLFYLLQLSLFTKTPEERSNIGWQVEQYLISNPQLQIGIPNVETAVFKYKGQHNPPGETNFYQRDMTFEVTARVLDLETAYIAKNILINQKPY
jgi:hypothetical protein